MAYCSVSGTKILLYNKNHKFHWTYKNQHWIFKLLYIISDLFSCQQQRSVDIKSTWIVFVCYLCWVKSCHAQQRESALFIIVIFLTTENNNNVFTLIWCVPKIIKQRRYNKAIACDIYSSFGQKGLKTKLTSTPLQRKKGAAVCVLFV